MTTPNEPDWLDKLLATHLHEIKAGHDGKLKAQILQKLEGVIDICRKEYIADADTKETKKVGVKINHWNGLNVIYESNKETLREAVFEAVHSGANLRGANLYGADLKNTELQNAKFYGKGGTKPLKRSQLPDFLAALGFIIEEDCV
jgi:hypothetical protein